MEDQKKSVVAVPAADKLTKNQRNINIPRTIELPIRFIIKFQRPIFSIQGVALRGLNPSEGDVGREGAVTTS
jgi:hypothetical protein